MASMIAATKSVCATCEKNTGIFICGGCTRAFCTKHANEHRQMLGQQMDEIVFEHNQLRQNINEQTDGFYPCPSMEEIDEWERQSIYSIHRIAEIVRQELRQCLVERTQYIQTSVEQLKEKLNKAHIEDDFVETDLKLWYDKINELKSYMSTYIPIFFKSIDDDLIRFPSQCQAYDDVKYQINDSLFVRGHQQNSYSGARAKPEAENQLSPFDTSRADFYPRVIELSKTSGRLGFRIEGGRGEYFLIYMSRIIPNGVAWKHGGLKIGDQLLSVNGVSVENEYHKKAFDLLKQAQGSVKLVVRYSPQVLIEMENP